MKLITSDEWIDSGAQMTAACELLESIGASVVGIGTLQLAPGRLEIADALADRYDVFAANTAPPQPGVSVCVRVSRVI